MKPRPSSGIASASCFVVSSQCGQSVTSSPLESASSAMAPMNTEPSPSRSSSLYMRPQSCGSVPVRNTRPIQVAPPRKRLLTCPRTVPFLARGSSRAAIACARFTAAARSASFRYVPVTEGEAFAAARSRE